MNATVKELVAAARRRGIEAFVPDSDGGFVRFSHAGRERWVHKTRTPFLSSLSAKIVTDKILSGRLLNENGFPVAEKLLVADLTEDAFAFLETHGSIVVKPNHQDRGVGVTLNVRTRTGLSMAFENAREFGPVLLERFVNEREYRLLVIGGRFAGALEWEPTLALGENAKPGGERAMDRTETVHPWFRDLAVRAAELFQVDVAGIDLMTPKISVKPENLARTAVLEINPSPDFLAHLHPAVGSPQPVCELFLDHLFAK